MSTPAIPPIGEVVTVRFSNAFKTSRYTGWVRDTYPGIDAFSVQIGEGMPSVMVGPDSVIPADQLTLEEKARQWELNMLRDTRPLIEVDWADAERYVTERPDAYPGGWQSLSYRQQVRQTVDAARRRRIAQIERVQQELDDARESNRYITEGREDAR